MCFSSSNLLQRFSFSLISVLFLFFFVFNVNLFIYNQTSLKLPFSFFVINQQIELNIYRIETVQKMSLNTEVCMIDLVL